MEERWAKYYKKSENKGFSKNLTKALECVRRGEYEKTAIDLGCGVGCDTVELLRRGWSVTAIDVNDVTQYLMPGLPEEWRQRLRFVQERFQDASFPVSHLVNANLALPFCPPDDFGNVWKKINKSVCDGGFFAGNFFGIHDQWSEDQGMTFIEIARVKEMFTGWSLVYLNEKREDAMTAAGYMKHWHIIDVVAIKKPS